MNIKTKVILYFLVVGVLYFISIGDYLHDLRSILYSFEEVSTEQQTNLQQIQVKGQVKDLSSELVWYDTEKAIEHHLQPEYLDEISNYLINHLKGSTIEDTIWNIILWEDKVIKYDYEKAKHSSLFSYTTDEHGRVISIDANSNNKIQTPQQTIDRKKGICIDYAILTAAILLRCGCQPVYIFDTGYHAFAAVKINGKFYAIDQHPPIEDVISHLYDVQDEYGHINEVYYYKIWIENNKTKIEKHKFKYWGANSTIIKVYLNGIEYKKAAQVIMEKIIKHYPNLKPDPNINDLDKMEYLPSGYVKGITYTYTWEGVEVNKVFERQYGEWFAQEIIHKLPDDISDYNRIWVKVVSEGGSTKVKIYLAKW